MKVAFFSSEVFPFAKTGGLADVCGTLPLALEQEGIKPVIFLPYYKCVKEMSLEVERIGPDVLRHRTGKNIDVFFIAHDYFYMRDGLYSDQNGDFGDNFERFHFFCKRSMDVLRSMNYTIDIFHCNDWQSSLIPVFLKEIYQKDDFYKNVKSVLTIHNLAYQGVFPAQKFGKLKLRPELFHQDFFEFYGKINLLKAGIIYADEVTTVSPRYSKEIQTKQFGCNLDQVLQHSENKIVGVLNGLDYNVWDPASDSFLQNKYSSDNYLEGKTNNKKSLQKRVSLPNNPDVPVFGMVGRLSSQKGIDLILKALPKLLKKDVQVIIQGLGQDDYINNLSEFAKKHPNKMAVCFEFDESLAHLIYSGSDFFLMPSTFEPCGLSQMIAFKYGTPPIVFKTGGLIDTVLPFNSDNNGNGFMFDEYKVSSFLDCIKRVMDVYSKKETFDKVVNNALKANFPWDHSAKNYIEIYKCLLSG